MKRKIHEPKNRLLSFQGFQVTEDLHPPLREKKVKNEFGFNTEATISTRQLDSSVCEFGFDTEATRGRTKAKLISEFLTLFFP